MKEFIIESIEELKKPAKYIIDRLSEKPIVAFYGEMGVGKTTFIKVIGELMGVEDYINSPTFAIVNEYSDKNRNPVYHFDLYRIEDSQELSDIGFDDYLDSKYPCLIEWPTKAEELIPDERINILIEEIDSEKRKILIKE